LAKLEMLRVLPPQVIDLPPQIPLKKPVGHTESPPGAGKDISQASGTPGEMVGETLDETTGEATRDAGDSTGAAADDSEASERAREAGSNAPPRSTAEPTVDRPVNQPGETTNSDTPKGGSDDPEEPPAIDPFRRAPRT